MRKFLPLLLLLASCASAPPAHSRAAINALLDDWHLAASRADEARYFGAMTPESGVVRRVGGEWKIAHYNLTIPIPNDLSKKVVEMIRTK